MKGVWHMELRTTREMRRNERLARAMTKEKKVEGAAAPAQSQPARQPADKLTLSRQALNYLEEHNRLAWERDQQREQQRQGRMNDSLSALDSGESQLDSMEKKLKVMNKCQKIAASIMRGNRVPPEDLAYLMNNDPEGYKLAMAMRRENPDPEDCESVLDEEDRAGASGGGYGEDAASIEGVFGGGEAAAEGEPA